jgi:uncharacterized membrane protein
MTAPAAVCWAAHLGWLPLSGTKLDFLARPLALWIIIVMALGELIADKLPKTPARTAPLGLSARAVLGGACGFAVATGKHTNPVVPVTVAVAGALLGAFAGYNLRRFLVAHLRLPDFVVALAEDAIAITSGLLILSRV